MTTTRTKGATKTERTDAPPAGPTLHDLLDPRVWFRNTRPEDVVARSLEAVLYTLADGMGRVSMNDVVDAFPRGAVTPAIAGLRFAGKVRSDGREVRILGYTPPAPMPVPPRAWEAALDAMEAAGLEHDHDGADADGAAE